MAIWSDNLPPIPATAFSQPVVHRDKVRGSEDYNRTLSLKRAEAVRNALIQNGVAQQRINTVGYVESRPISSDHALNRRVEIIITPIRQG
ncbi:MAG: OmpA family protein [Desulfotignum sp.]